MSTISSFNSGLTFEYELRESRLKKCQRIIQTLPAGRMLDIGCSTGEWGVYWQHRGWEASGIDIDRKHLEIARRRQIDARLCDLNHDPLPFERCYFDLIFAGEVIEHLIDTDYFLDEVERCLRPGGALLITTPNLASFENRVRILLGMYPKWMNYNLSGSGHVRDYTPRILKKQLREHGLEVSLHTGNWVPFIPQHFLSDLDAPILSVTGDLLPSLAMDIIMLARKGAAPVQCEQGESRK